MPEETPRKLLNPFAFPSETQLRSILLIWAILGLCWGMGFYFASALVGALGWPVIEKLPSLNYNILHIDEETSIDPSLDTIRLLLERMGPAYRELEEPGGLARAQAALAVLSKTAHLRLKVFLPYFAIPFLFLAVALLCILGLYVVRARRLWLSGRASSRLEKPEFQNALQSLFLEAEELQRQQGEEPMPKPRILLSPGAVGDGEVFGTSRRPFILLTRAMSVILRKEIRQRGEPYSFRAVVFHELAHLANRDVTRSRWAEASWIVLVPVLTVLIATLWMLRSSLEASAWLQAGVRAMAICFVIELIRRGILRSREHEADLRTALLWNAGGPLSSSLGEDARAPSLWRKHPTTAERREVLAHPSRALGLKMDIPFLAGLLFGNLIGSILSLAAVITLAANASVVLMNNSINQGLVHSRGTAMAMRLYGPVGSLLWIALMLLSALALFCAVSYLLAGTLGVQVQRESVLQMVEAERNPHPYRSLLKPAFFTAAGFEIGLILVPMAPALPGRMWELLSLIVWVPFATLAFWGWLSTVRLFAKRLLGSHFAFRKPVRQLRIVTWASTFLLWPLILILLGGQFWIWPALGGMRAMTAGAIILLGLLFLLLLMLLALAVREIRLEDRRPRCPHCGLEVSSTSAVADCASCGNSLTPWLFVKAPSVPEAGVA